MDEESHLNEEYVELCRRYSLNSSMLKEIIYYRSLGYNNQVIAEKLGTTRQTVHNYTNKIRLMERDEFAVIVLAALVGFAGLALIIKILSQKNNQ